MRRFQALYDRLDQLNGTKAKVEVLIKHFRTCEAEDSAWALALLLGKRRRRLITGRRLRDVLQERTGLPEWLIADCHGQVGDSAETLSLLWPEVRDRLPPISADLPDLSHHQPLHWWMETLLPHISGLKGDDQTDAVLSLWQSLPQEQQFIVNKLLTGGFRVGVSTGLISRAVAAAFGLEESLVVQRLMGGYTPSAESFRALTAPADAEEQINSGRPYPFFLASPLEAERIQSTEASDWLLEWKWDGIRGQLIHRGDRVYLWSRGEELINDSFPELVALGDALPTGTVLDGEIICWEEDDSEPLGFDVLQRRLGRKQVGSTLRRDCPVCFIAYDLLEINYSDVREHSLEQRQHQLKEVLTNIHHPEQWRLRQSDSWLLNSWDALDHQRDKARQRKAEGLMLKHRKSPYLSGRRRGHWWKHKLEPMSLDAVLIYAQAGSGRRANLFTDYTFGLWDGESPAQLVSFAKAYSGLNDEEIVELDRWIRRHTLQRFGPARSVNPELVFEIGFEGIHPSKRHKSGLAVRFPRILRWRRDKTAAEADQLTAARALIR